MIMEGIKYLIDGKNNKVAVQIDLEKYGELIEEEVKIVKVTKVGHPKTFTIRNGLLHQLLHGRLHYFTEYIILSPREICTKTKIYLFYANNGGNRSGNPNQQFNYLAI